MAPGFRDFLWLQAFLQDFSHIFHCLVQVLSDPIFRSSDHWVEDFVLPLFLEPWEGLGGQNMPVNFVLDRVSHSPGWPHIHYVAQASLELTGLYSQPYKCCN